MKKLIIATLMLVLPIIASAQTTEFKKFYKLYDARPDYTTIQMSGDTFISLRGAQSSGNKKETISSIFIVTSDSFTAEFKADIEALILSPEYDLQTSINDGEDHVRFYVRKWNNSVVEILMTVVSPDNAVVMCVTGQNLNINSVSQIAGQ